MTKSSNINYRYPLKFDTNSPKNCDFLLIFPDVINKNTNIELDYEDNFKRLVLTLMKSSTYESINSNGIHYYPYTLILTSPFFMLEFCDIFPDLNKEDIDDKIKNSENSLFFKSNEIFI